MVQKIARLSMGAQQFLHLLPKRLVPGAGAVQISLFVVLASMPSLWETNAISFPSGERVNPTPPSEKGGESNSPGVRSVYDPEDLLNMSICVLFPSRQYVQ